ncbi:hypothetical protein [Mycolicibacterium confluentis]|uniref:Uncharacterized protein n=1 Tax=Mycolicibacterium confluentis TaxID=28047 RepID=A0A7I7Y427_9MYCO|nr:hypothetical protein [Mycolicibacterium confluentis]MCV7322691.1 hypothetical protein [Mycolicibacterium confluentis]ORV29777.1 hypothetical protein AWB99_16520 [Mycolicibacterium confluentis]BBZ36408.1 hypothetical protein MCNF_50130 [Mycolicibacterium confluentis]
MLTARLLCVLAAVVTAGLWHSPASHAEPFFANYQLVIPDRYDFHTWTWAVTHCLPVTEGCVSINAIPMPVAKAFEYVGEARLVDGRYTLTVDVPDGLRCGNVYYGPVIPTRDVYSWDSGTLQGTLTSSFDAGCDGTPAGAFTYPFSLVRL